MEKSSAQFAFLGVFFQYSQKRDFFLAGEISAALQYPSV